MVLVKPALTVTEQQVRGRTVIITVQRDLLEEGVCPLKEAIDQLAASADWRIVIDLQHVPVMDSGDVGRLIRAHLTVRKRGRRIHLCGVLPRVERLLRMTRLDTVFKVHESCSGAIDTEDDSPG